MGVLGVLRSDLVFGQSDEQTVEFVTDNDLAAEATIGLGIEYELQHLRFHLVGCAGFHQPVFVHIAVACGAAAGTPAISQDTRDTVIGCCVHKSGAGCYVNIPFAAVVADEFY
jgi:hypothetical protein